MAASKTRIDNPASRISWGSIAFGVLSGLGSLASIYSAWKLVTTINPLKYPLYSLIVTFAIPLIVFGFIVFAGWLSPRRVATTAIGLAGRLGRWRDDESRINAITSCLQRLENFMPSPVCQKHKERISQSFLSFRKFVINNGRMAWLMPPASDDMLLAHAEQFTESQFKEWSYLLTDKNGLLEHSKYVFITWDLTDPQDWDSNLLQKLAPMLHDLGRRTVTQEMFVHRILIVRSSDVASRGTDFLSTVWNPYIKPYVDASVLASGSGNDHYRIKFLYEEKFNRLFAGGEAPLAWTFYDVAMFSSSVNIKNRISATSDGSCVLPAPLEVGDSTEYDAWQFSQRPPIEGSARRGIIHLYIVGNGGLDELSKQKRLELIRSARERAKKVIDKVLADPNQNVDDEIMGQLGIRFHKFQ